ncbi:MAG TPA: hypothetical protein VL443_04380 [Cyclobacteriaceae bacterium]|jgi:hypothetical protein|nr:hypothetical protein [Cyclobacteriaceae bacterium]
MDEYEEDPVEIYKREFKRKRWEKEQAQKAKTEQYRRTSHKYFRFLAFPAALFALILIIDKYLPGNVYQETVDKGWQERTGGSRRSRGELISFMQTENFELAVPHEIHLHYPYNESNRPPLLIAVSPIFKIPLHATVDMNNKQYKFDILETIHSFYLPLTWMLLITSLVCIYFKQYSWSTYTFAFVPAIILFAIYLKW